MEIDLNTKVKMLPLTDIAPDGKFWHGDSLYLVPTIDEKLKEYMPVHSFLIVLNLSNGILTMFTDLTLNVTPEPRKLKIVCCEED